MTGGFGGPRIPHGMGGGVNTPDGNAFRFHANVMALPNAKCVKCGCESFEIRANMKMVSPMMSPNGQWGHGVAQWWQCTDCKHIFVMEEWVKKHEAEAESPIVVPPAGRAD